MLKASNCNGAWLLRESETNPGAYVVSVMRLDRDKRTRGIRHIRVLDTENGLTLGPGCPVMPSVWAAVENAVGVPLNEDENPTSLDSPLVLGEPVLNTSITDVWSSSNEEFTVDMNGQELFFSSASTMRRRNVANRNQDLAGRRGDAASHSVTTTSELESLAEEIGLGKLCGDTAQFLVGNVSAAKIGMYNATKLDASNYMLG